MVIAGEALVPPAPPRPGEQQLPVARSRPEHVSKQMAHFGNGEGKQRLGLLWGLLWQLEGLAGFVLNADPDEKGMSQHHQRYVYVIRNRSGANYSRITYIIWTVTKEHSE